MTDITSKVLNGMSEPSTQSFLKILERSGLLDNGCDQKLYSAIKQQVQDGTLSLDDLTKQLLEKELITDWHLQKLLSGKYKGFYLGKYKLLGHLGTGGMSSVYLAEHQISRQRRAIKVLPRKRVSDKSYLDRFYLEARAAASLNHPNIVRIYDICHEGETHYMVMEYVPGKDLYEVVKGTGPLGCNKAVEFCVQAAEGLSHAHKRSLVHRDIKPANLLLANDGVVKILDLGLALMNQDDRQSLTLLYNEKVMGTADYLSPEQAVNSHDVDSRSDIYSLGCTLYFLLAGHPPFPKGTLAQRIAMHQQAEPTPLVQVRPDCPASLAAICRQMMQKNPQHRYQTCNDLKLELLHWLDTGQRLGTGLIPGTLIAEESSEGNHPINEITQPIQINISGSSKSAKSTKKNRSSKKVQKASGSVIVPLSEKPTDGRGSPSSSSLASSGNSSWLKWILPVAIVSMFLLLLLVLFIVSQFLTDSELP